MYDYTGVYVWLGEGAHLIRRAKKLSMAITHFYLAFQTVEDILHRRWSEWPIHAMIIGSLFDHSELGKMIRSAEKWDAVFQKIYDAHTVEDINRLMSPQPSYAWSFHQAQAKGVVHFRLPPASQTAEILIKWIYFTIGFVLGAVNRDKPYIKGQEDTREALHAFVAKGLERRVLDDPLIINQSPYASRDLRTNRETRTVSS